MTHALLVILSAFAVLSGHLAAKLPSPSCGINEQWSECPSTCGTECPKTEDDVTNTGCPKTKCSEGGCECLFDHRRLSNGTCVPVKDCPPFECSRPNERYHPSPPLCPSDQCWQASPDGLCHLPYGRIGVVIIGTPKCRCIEGYWRKDGVCVPYDQCFTGTR